MSQNKVLFMQNFFCPDDNQFNRLKASLLSLLSYSERVKPCNENHFKIYGFAEKKYQEEIEDLCNNISNTKMFYSTHLQFQDTNVGKGAVCNKACNEYPCEYLFLFDNDICFPEDINYDIADRLIQQQVEMDLIGDLKYPIISANFLEHQVHILDALDQGYCTKFGLVKCSTGNFGCLGGGCWLVKKSHWDELGGYCSNTIYGRDDGQLYLDTLKIGKMVCLSIDVCVIHPVDTDKLYNTFKADTNVNRVRKMNYAELTTDSDNFWRNR